MEKFVDYESFAAAKFKEDFELCREMVINGIEEYYESGEDKDMTFIILNLGRIIKARGYKDFAQANLSDSQIDSAIKDKENYDRDAINKMLKALGIKEQI